MLEKATIARPYAEAAFAQAKEEGKLTEWSELLNVLGLIVSDAGMRSVINNPQVGDDQLYGIIADICVERMSETGANFVKILIVSGRIGLAKSIFSLFESKRTSAEGIADIDVISAYPLDDVQANTLSDAIARRLGKKVDIHTEEDKDLIGGVVIRVGDSVFDASLRGRLNELNNVLAQ